MITIKDHKQQELFDPWAFLSPKRRRLLDEGWPGLFRTQILEELPVGQVSPSFCSDFTRLFEGNRVLAGKIRPALSRLRLLHICADGCPRTQQLPTERSRHSGPFIQMLRKPDDF